jgi:hypothetical protein
MATLTLTEVAVMDEAISDLRLLHFALDAKEQEIGKRAVMVADAWGLFDVAIDEGRPADTKNELLDVAYQAEAALSQAKQERDGIKATLLAVMS